MGPDPLEPTREPWSGAVGALASARLGLSPALSPVSGLQVTYSILGIVAILVSRVVKFQGTTVTRHFPTGIQCEKGVRPVREHHTVHSHPTMARPPTLGSGGQPAPGFTCTARSCTKHGTHTGTGENDAVNTGAWGCQPHMAYVPQRALLTSRRARPQITIKAEHSECTHL